MDSFAEQIRDLTRNRVLDGCQRTELARKLEELATFESEADAEHGELQAAKDQLEMETNRRKAAEKQVENQTDTSGTSFDSPAHAVIDQLRRDMGGRP